MLEPPDSTTCLYSSPRMSTAAFWIVWKSISGRALANIGAAGWVVRRTCYARLLDVDKMGLEHTFGRLEALGADFDRPAIWELWGCEMSWPGMIHWTYCVAFYEDCRLLREARVHLEVVARITGQLGSAWITAGRT